MKWVETISGYLNKWTIGIRRLPVLLFYGLFLCAYLSIQIHNDQEPQSRLFWALWIGAMVSLLVSVYMENYRKTPGLLLAAITSAIVSILLYYIMAPGALGDHYWQNIYCGVIVLMLHLLVTLVPFKTREDVHFLRYNFQLLENFLTSFVIAFILFTGLSLAVLAISTLFDIGVEGGELYGHLAVWILIGIQLVNFIALFPSLPIDTASKAKMSSRFFRVFVNYIGVPVIGIYFSILLAYAAKVLISGEDVVVWIVEMCCWYIGLGLFVYLAARRLLIEEVSKVSGIYLRFFFLTLIIPVLLLGQSWFALYHTKGFKEETYLLALILIFGAVLFILFNLRKSADLRGIPGLVIFLLAVYILPGPSNVKNLSRKWQEHRLEEKAITAHLFLDNKVVKVDKSLKINTDTVSDIVQYLNKYHDLGFLKKYDKDSLLGDTISLDSLSAIWPLKGIQFVPDPEAPREHLFNDFLPELTFDAGVTISDIVVMPVRNTSNFTGFSVNEDGGLSRYVNGAEREKFTVYLSEISKEKITMQRGNNSIEIYFVNLNYVPAKDVAKLFYIEGFVVQKEE